MGYGLLSLVLVVGLFGAYTYRHLNENLTVLDVEKQLGDRPTKVDVGPGEPLNILVMGSDSREGDGNNIDGLTGGGQRSDTTIMFHLSADRSFAYGVSLPRDGMVQRPTCYNKDQSEIPGGFDMWNAAFALGGPACTIRQFEQLTKVKIDHFVVVDFNGFKDMVDAVDGVEICVPEEVNDTHGNIHLDAGTQTVKGQTALNYVRVRNDISANGDLGRMKRQQAFIASMTNKVVSAGTLTRPDRLFKFVDASTKSLTVDKKLDSVRKIADLGGQFQGVGLDQIKFITVPNGAYPEDPNRLIWTDQADTLWDLVRRDQPLGPKLTAEVLTAENKPGKKSDKGETSGGSGDGGGTTTPTKKEVAEANGLCS